MSAVHDPSRRRHMRTSTLPATDHTTAAPPDSTTGFRYPCRQVHLRSASDMAALLDAVIAAMVEQGYTPADCRELRLALEEAIVNGLKHGNGGDPAKRVRAALSRRAGSGRRRGRGRRTGLRSGPRPRPNRRRQPGQAIGPRPAADAALHELAVLPRPGQPPDPLQVSRCRFARAAVRRPLPTPIDD